MEKEKVKTFVSSSSLFMKTHCFHSTSGFLILICVSEIIFIFMDYVWSIVYEHSSIVNSQLSVWMEAYGGKGNPKSFYIWL